MSTAVADVPTGRVVSESEAQEIEAAKAVASSARDIPIGLIEVAEIALRGVDTDGEEFQNLVQSIRQNGVLNSIVVRKIDLGGGHTKYNLIDGLQRFTASKSLALETIPANVVDADDDAALVMQIVTNATRVQTKPAEYAGHLYRLLARDPSETRTSLAAKLSVSRAWIDRHLQLNSLIPAAAELVDAGKINLTNAFVLAKLPAEEQPAWIDAAQNEKPETFSVRAKERAKELKDAMNKGEDAKAAEWSPSPHLRRVGVIKEEHDAIVNGNGDSDLLAQLEKHKVKGDAAVVKFTMDWLLNLDPDGVEKQKNEHAAAEEKAKAAKEKREKEREAAKIQAEEAKKKDPFKGF